MAGKRRRRCGYCRDLFRPDPRVGSKQKACSAEECQRRRHAAAHASWRERNPDCYRGRGVKHSTYREDVKKGRRVPTTRPARERREQDAISLQAVTPQRLDATLPTPGEQDAKSPQVLLLLGFAGCLSPPSRTPEQDEIDARVGAWHLLGLRALERAWEASQARRSAREAAPALEGVS